MGEHPKIQSMRTRDSSMIYKLGHLCIGIIGMKMDETNLDGDIVGSVCMHMYAYVYVYINTYRCIYIYTYV